ncbi:bifunctional serine/threonine-protein kinase/ABC transporter substrate-binding protein [Streptomyces sp. NPDC096132]|uniref:bifunctional serine/threonine-protein kinase/ABC transporter substrate-binding protein n=1 Tax=Streptomyces sp. NPDC096132 TaxID=3366075 RepID=UPI00380CF6CF
MPVTALRPGDPQAVGGHRLLGRLGAGGMGVVYLARTPGGALVALKVIRAEYAADPAFRVRFRREAEAVGRLGERVAARPGGRWLVPVTAADPEAREPWLATAYVPGPSLADAVARYGPLPPESVRVLGARLAEALAEVHTAGLVHRDVKPGNVLLALDGPRLIDFGIARSADATALTASDVVIGSPGYLSPEQAQAGRAERVGPPSDVFSLACVLAFASTARRPFGTGTPAAVIYRTVRETPDLTGVPAPLLPLLTACLTKAPGARPTAEEVRVALDSGWAAGSAARAAGEGGRPGTAAEGEPGSSTGGGVGAGSGGGPGSSSGGGWLPAPLPGLIAERAARVLELSVPVLETAELDETRVEARPSRRRFMALGAVVGVLGAGGGVAAWVARSGGGPGGGTGGGTGPLPRYTIGLHADLSGGTKSLGRAQERAARLAVEQHNARADREFDLVLKVRDDGGKPAQAVKTADAFAADDSVYAVIGPTTNETAVAAQATYQKALLPALIVSAGDERLSNTSKTAVFQLRPNDVYLTTPVGWYLTQVEPARRTAAVDDQAAGQTSWKSARSMNEYPPSRGTTTLHTVAAGSEDFRPAVEAAIAAKAQALVYTGTSAHRAALCARAAREAGFTGSCAAMEPVLGPAFLEEAGEAAEGWVFGTTYVDPSASPAPKAAKAFAAAYRKRYGVDEVPPYAAEAYDALGLATEGLRLIGPDGVERGGVTQRLRTLTYQGVCKELSFNSTTLQMAATPGLFLYRVEDGRARFLGQYETVK